MRKSFFCLASLAIFGMTLTAATVAEAAKGKSGFAPSRRSSALTSNSSLRSNLSTSRQLSSSPKMSKKFTTNSFQSNKNFSSQTLRKMPAGNFAPVTKNFGQLNTSLKNQRSLNNNFTQKNSNSNLNSALLKKGPTTPGNLRNQTFNPGGIAKLQKNPQLGPDFKVGNGPSTERIGNFPGATNPINKGAIQGAINNGRLTPIGDGISNGIPNDNGNGTPPESGLTGRLKPLDLENVVDNITDRGVPNIGLEVENPPSQNPSPDADPGQNPSPDADPGQGSGGAEPPADPNEPPYCPPQDDCHHDFPWWPPVIVGGGCYHDACYDTVITTPGTNVTLVEQTVVAPVVEIPAAGVIAGADLELLDVRLIDAGDTARNLGPRYRLVFRNRGTVPVGNFQLLLMASRDGKPAADSPRETADLAGLAAGETLSADVRLPHATDLASFAALIVALDSAVQIEEVDEQNNVAVLDRAKIAAADPTTVAAR